MRRTSQEGMSGTSSVLDNMAATEATKSTETVWMVSNNVVTVLWPLLRALSITRFLPSDWTTKNRSIGRHAPTPNLSSNSFLVKKGEQKRFSCSSWVTARISSWKRGGPDWTILLTASSAWGPSQSSRSGAAEGVTWRKTPLLTG